MMLLYLVHVFLVLANSSCPCRLYFRRGVLLFSDTMKNVPRKTFAVFRTSVGGPTSAVATDARNNSWTSSAASAKFVGTFPSWTDISLEHSVSNSSQKQAIQTLCLLHRQNPSLHCHLLPRVELLIRKYVFASTRHRRDKNKLCTFVFFRNRPAPVAV